MALHRAVRGLHGTRAWRRPILHPALLKTQRNHATAVAASEQIEQPTVEDVARQHTTPRLDSLKSAKPFSAFLTDTFNRQHDYLRISITEKCNLRCLYCMPAEGVPLSPKKHLLTPQEILYLSSLFVSQGVTKIRLTGGEPTVHPQILPLLRDIGSLRQHGLQELAITTNGLSLVRKLDSMVESGLTGINLSLDTLDPFQFEIMTRRRGFEQVMKSISRILEMKRLGANIKLKVNAVVIRGLNDAQIMPFVDMTRDNDVEVRFIEYMPFDGNKWSNQKMLTYHEMLGLIREQYPAIQKLQDHPNDTSKTYQVPGFAGKIGFITSMTDHFCGSCNRLRITSDGNLKVCLFGNSEVNLRDLVRDGFNAGEPLDEAALEAIKEAEMDRKEGRTQGDFGLQEKEMQLLDVIGMAVKRKKEKHAGIGELEHMQNRPMILIDELIGKSWNNATPRPRSTKAQQLAPITLLAASTLHHPSALLARGFSSASRSQTALPILDNQSLQLTHLTSTGAARMVNIPSPGRSRPSSPLEDHTEPSSQSGTSTSADKDSTAVGDFKAITTRIATAVSTLKFSNPHPYRLILNSLSSTGASSPNQHNKSSELEKAQVLPKGDVISTARIAGIMAAKKTSDLIPLCHNIPLAGVDVDVELVEPSDIAALEAKSQGLGVDDAGRHGGIRTTAKVTCHGQTGVEMEALTAANVAALTVYDMCKAVDRGMRIEGLRVVQKTGGSSGDWKDGVRVG